MKRRIETRHLNRCGPSFTRCFDPGDVVGLMQGSKRDELLEPIDHLAGNDHRRVVMDAAMNDTVADRVYARAGKCFVLPREDSPQSFLMESRAIRLRPDVVVKRRARVISHSYPPLFSRHLREAQGERRAPRHPQPRTKRI